MRKLCRSLLIVNLYFFSALLHAVPVHWDIDFFDEDQNQVGQGSFFFDDETYYDQRRGSTLYPRFLQTEVESFDFTLNGKNWLYQISNLDEVGYFWSAGSTQNIPLAGNYNANPIIGSNAWWIGDLDAPVANDLDELNIFGESADFVPPIGAQTVTGTFIQEINKILQSRPGTPGSGISNPWSPGPGSVTGTWTATLREGSGGNNNHLTTLHFESTDTGEYASVSESGYRFTLTYAPVAVLMDSSNALSAIWGDTIRLHREDDAIFDMIRFQVKGRWPGVTGNLIVRGLFADGSVQEKTIAYSQDAIPLSEIPDTPWITVGLGWKDLKAVEMYTPDGRALLDEFVFSGGDGDNNIGGNKNTLQFEATPPDSYDRLEESGYQFTSTFSTLDVLQDSSRTLSGLWGNTIFLRRIDDSKFNLTRFKAKGRWPAIRGEIIIRGTFADGSTKAQTVSYSQPEIPLASIPETPWMPIDLNWGNLTEVSISTSNGRALLDDFEVSL